LFSFEYSDINSEWYSKSNYLGLLSVNNEDDLINLIEKATTRGIKTSVFREPDIGNKVTAIALEPSIMSKKLCSNLPLALKEMSVKEY
jgi:hypothetical protein